MVGRPTANFLLACMRAWTAVRDTGLVSMGERLRCVIVDDNLDFLDAAARLLERQGIEVVGLAQSSSAGVHCVEALRPDVALVDIDLGSESGFDLVEQLHPDTSGAGPPVILISTHAEQDFAELIETGSAVAFLPKSSLSGPAIREVLGLLG
jgi:CheY-like chemotaxis protein